MSSNNYHPLYWTWCSAPSQARGLHKRKCVSTRHLCLCRVLRCCRCSLLAGHMQTVRSIARRSTPTWSRLRTAATTGGRTSAGTTHTCASEITPRPFTWRRLVDGFDVIRHWPRPWPRLLTRIPALNLGPTRDTMLLVTLPITWTQPFGFISSVIQWR